MYEKYALLRDKMGLSDYRVAKETGIASSTLTNWKKGNYQPKIDKIAILSKYFGVPIEYFLQDTTVDVQ